MARMSISYRLLNEVDEEEASTDHQLGQPLNPNTLLGDQQTLAHLGETIVEEAD